MQSKNLRYFVKGLPKILGKFKFVFWFLNPISKSAKNHSKITRYVKKYLSLVVDHLTIFDLLIQRGFSS